jgi:hypothetical protein
VLIAYAQPCVLCEWIALWDKVEPILLDRLSDQQAAPPVTDDLQSEFQSTCWACPISSAVE